MTTALISLQITNPKLESATCSENLLVDKMLNDKKKTKPDSRDCVLSLNCYELFYSRFKTNSFLNSTVSMALVLVP